MKLFFATGNKGKVKELEALIEGMDLQVLYMADVPDFVSPEETGTTFRENARIIARSACGGSGRPAGDVPAVRPEYRAGFVRGDRTVLGLPLGSSSNVTLRRPPWPFWS